MSVLPGGRGDTTGVAAAGELGAPLSGARTDNGMVQQSVYLITSVADPYHFDTDPDPGCEKICYGSGSRSRVNFDTDPDPAKKD